MDEAPRLQIDRDVVVGRLRGPPVVGRVVLEAKLPRSYGYAKVSVVLIVIVSETVWSLVWVAASIACGARSTGAPFGAMRCALWPPLAQTL
jgi:hypothetical protein